MSIATAEEAAKNALARTRNIPDTCQIVTRGYYGAPSVGDFDGDGSADAEDGWKREPANFKHPGDRKPPKGFPVSWLHGSSDHGHRAISLGPDPQSGIYMIRSTDAPSRGVTSTVPLSWIEEHWGLEYAGWSETISGIKIPHRVKPVTRITEARDLLQEARGIAKTDGKLRRVKRINAALEILPWK